MRAGRYRTATCRGKPDAPAVKWGPLRGPNPFPARVIQSFRFGSRWKYEKQSKAASDELTVFLYGRNPSVPMPGPFGRGVAAALGGIRPEPRGFGRTKGIQ